MYQKIYSQKFENFCLVDSEVEAGQTINVKKTDEKLSERYEELKKKNCRCNSESLNEYGCTCDCEHDAWEDLNEEMCNHPDHFYVDEPLQLEPDEELSECEYDDEFFVRRYRDQNGNRHNLTWKLDIDSATVEMI